MKENVVKDKSFAFALRAVKLAKHLQADFIDRPSYESIGADSEELVKLLVSIVKTSKGTGRVK